MRVSVDDKFKVVSIDLLPREARLENPMQWCNMEDESMNWSRWQDRTAEWNRHDDINVYDEGVDRKTDDHVTFRTLEYSR